MWWDEDKSRWEREVEDMRHWFPVSDWSQVETESIKMRFWQVLVEPIPTGRELQLLISDLDRDGAVEMLRDGRLSHSARCHAKHEGPNSLKDLKLVDEAFLIEVLYREPPALPIARCIDPPLSRKTCPEHPHFYEPDIICPLFPPDRTWQWARNTAADYMVHVSVWLFKTAVWLVAKKASGCGYWLGSEVDHNPSRLSRTDASAPCMCGSGMPYRRCHRQIHRAALEGFGR